MYTTIIGVADLKRLMASGVDLAIFDTRHVLTAPDQGAQAFLQGHIPGALFAHLDHDLAAPVSERADGNSGRHPLPDMTDWLKRLGTWGIAPETQAVAYDDAGGMLASRMWWMLRMAGHAAAAVLDGGLPAWLAAGGALESGAAVPRPARPPYSGRAAYTDERTQADVSADVAKPAGEQRFLLVDARTPERFRGEVEPYGPVAGHIPGAINAFYGGNLNPDGTFRSAAELRARFAPIVAQAGGREVVMYCGSGVSACHNLLAMEIAGLPTACLFPNSWSGWSATPGLPVAKGEA